MCVVPFVNADVIPMDSHPLSKCVEIVNLNNFSDAYIIGYITGPMVEDYETYFIGQNECLTSGYKFNTLKIIAAKKSYVDSIGIKNIDISNENIFVSEEKINPYGGYVNENDPLINLKIEYSIQGFLDGKLILYKSKKTSEYNNGTPKKVETYEKSNIQNIRLNIGEINNSEPTPKLTPKISPEQIPEPKSFLNKFVWFFKGLFGKNCENDI